MLDKIFVIFSAWFLLSLMVGLLAGRAISTFREAPARHFAPSVEVDCGAIAFNELEEEETLVLSHAQM